MCVDFDKMCLPDLQHLSSYNHQEAFDSFKDKLNSAALAFENAMADVITAKWLIVLRSQHTHTHTHTHTYTHTHTHSTHKCHG